MSAGPKDESRKRYQRARSASYQYTATLAGTLSQDEPSETNQERLLITSQYDLPLPIQHVRTEQAILTWRHWVVLFLACFLAFGPYYCYDLPGALSTGFRDWLGRDDGVWQYELNTLYAVYSIPNIVLPIFGGVLVDLLGVNIMLAVFTALVLFGQAIFALGVTSKSFAWMVIGRIIFGMGSETLEVAQTNITTDWFNGKYLGFALGLNITSLRLATSANDFISPYISAHLGGPVVATWLSWGIALCSALATILLLYLDRNASRRIAGIAPSTQTHSLIDWWRRRGARPPQLPTEDGDETDSEDNRPLLPTADQSEEHAFHWSDVRKFSPTFWVLALSTVLMYGAVNPYIHILSGYLQDKYYPGDAIKAGRVMSIPDVISAVGSPLCGLIMDKWGHRGAYLPLSAGFFLLVHGLMAFTKVDAVPSLTLLGIAYSFFASALWPCVPYLVERKRLGTANGIMMVSLNLALSVFPIMVAAVQNNAGYFGLELFFMGAAGAGLLSTGFLLYLDKQGANALAQTHGHIVLE